MLLFVKGASVIGSLLVIIALVIALLKALIGFVGFVAVAIKIVILLIFLFLLASVGFMVLRTWQANRKGTE
jgi:multisubunit Na+/H+ antiporter MnhG subunit